MPEIAITIHSQAHVQRMLAATWRAGGRWRKSATPKLDEHRRNQLERVPTLG